MQELIEFKSSKLWKEAKKNVRAKIRAEQLVPFSTSTSIIAVISFFLWLFADWFFSVTFFISLIAIFSRNYVLPFGKIDEKEIYDEYKKIKMGEIREGVLTLKRDLNNNRRKLKRRFYKNLSNPIKSEEDLNRDFKDDLKILKQKFDENLNDFKKQKEDLKSNV